MQYLIEITISDEFVAETISCCNKSENFHKKYSQIHSEKVFSIEYCMWELLIFKKFCL